MGLVTAISALVMSKKCWSARWSPSARARSMPPARRTADPPAGLAPCPQDTASSAYAGLCCHS
jgi:hypothetical protein